LSSIVYLEDAQANLKIVRDYYFMDYNSFRTAAYLNQKNFNKMM